MTKDVEWLKLSMELEAQFTKRGTCSYPGCNEKAIRSHTIQRSGKVNAIAENGKVYTCNNKLGHLLKKDWDFNLVGVGEATTFYGFCSEHDNNVFQPVEKHKWTGSVHQAFLLAYRELCRDLRGKEYCFTTLRKMYPNCIAPDLFLGLREVRSLKQQFDNILIEQTWNDNISFLSFKSACILPYAVCNFFGPLYDITGELVQNQADHNIPFEYMLFNVFPNNDYSIILFVWKNRSSRIVRFIQKLLSVPADGLINALFFFCLEATDNHILKPSWYDGLVQSMKDKLKSHAFYFDEMGDARPFDFTKIPILIEDFVSVQASHGVGFL